MPDLTIVVVNWNTCDLLERCLQAIYTTVQTLAFDVWVVDNASTDGSVLMVQRRFPQVKLITNAENSGFASANNQAITASQGKYILLLNSDAFLTGNAVQQMVGYLAQNDRTGIVGANLVFPDGRPQISYGPLPSLSSEIASLWGLDKRRAAKLAAQKAVTPIETGMVSGACLMLRRSLLDQIGLFDEDFYFFSEEIDLCCRAQKSGWKVIHLPSASTTHVGGGSTGETAGRILLLYRGKLQYFKKHFGSVKRYLFYAQIWLATLVKVVGYTLQHWFSPRQPRKDSLWCAVLKGLAQLHM